MSIPAYIFDHVEAALAELVSRLDHPFIQALVRIFAEELQEIEDVLFALVVERFLDAAVGAQLDQWAKVVGERRDGFNDEELRDFIRARILSNLSNGEAPRLTTILSLLMRSDNVRYAPVYPAAMAFDYIRSTPSSEARRTRVKAQMETVAPAGVAIDAIVEAPEGYFGFADDPDALGFGEGGFSEVI